MSHPHPIRRAGLRSCGLILLALLATATGAAWAQDREASAKNECRRTPSLSEGPALLFALGPGLVHLTGCRVNEAARIPASSPASISAACSTRC